MSFFLNDTLQKQIERGEIWSGGTTFTDQPADEQSVLGVEVGSKETQFILEVNTSSSVRVIVTEGVSTVGGVVSQDINLNREGSFSKETDVLGVYSSTGGTIIVNRDIPIGLAGSSSQFNGEIGIILASNTNYKYQVANGSGSPATFQLTWFYREL